MENASGYHLRLVTPATDYGAPIPWALMPHNFKNLVYTSQAKLDRLKLVQ